MKSQKELIAYYEAMLKKVVKAYAGDCRKEAYIESAKRDLEAAKNGRKW